jgi:hypothetical protein
MGLLQLLGTVGSLGAAIWIWRFSRIASVFRYIAVVVGVITASSIAGVISIEFHPQRALDLGRTLLDLLGPLLGGLPI